MADLRSDEMRREAGLWSLGGGGGGKQGGGAYLCSDGRGRGRGGESGAATRSCDIFANGDIAAHCLGYRLINELGRWLSADLHMLALGRSRNIINRTSPLL